jgi:hypothetical protein
VINRIFNPYDERSFYWFSECCFWRSSTAEGFIGFRKAASGEAAQQKVLLVFRMLLLEKQLNGGFGFCNF